MSHNANMLAAKADPLTIKRSRDAAKKVGMSLSDLVRIGTARAVAEIEETGGIRVNTKPQPKKTKP